MQKKIYALLLLVFSGVLSIIMSYSQTVPQEFQHFIKLIKYDVKFKFLALLLLLLIILVTICVFYVYTTISYYIITKFIKLKITYDQTFFAVLLFMIITSYQFLVYYFLQKSFFLSVLSPLSILGICVIYLIYRHYRIAKRESLLAAFIIYLLSIVFTIIIDL